MQETITRKSNFFRNEKRLLKISFNSMTKVNMKAPKFSKFLGNESVLGDKGSLLTGLGPEGTEYYFIFSKIGVFSSAAGSRLFNS